MVSMAARFFSASALMGALMMFFSCGPEESVQNRDLYTADEPEVFMNASDISFEPASREDMSSLSHVTNSDSAFWTRRVDFSNDNFRIPLEIFALPEKGGTCFVGVPFPEGWLGRGVRVVTTDGRPVRSASRIMALWPESDAVRWLGVEFEAKPDETYAIVPAESTPSMPQAAEVAVKEVAGGYEVVTGPAKFVLPMQGPLIARAYFDSDGDGVFAESEKLLAHTEGDDLYVVNQNGIAGVIGKDAEEGQLQFETAGENRFEPEPLLRAVFRREGWYVTESGERLARHITRLFFDAGSPSARIEHTLILTEDTEKTWFDEYGLRFRFASAAIPDRVFFPKSDAAGAPVFETKIDASGEAYLFQEKAFYMSRMDPVEDCHFEIGRTREEENEVLESGSLAGNWMLVGNSSVSMGVAVRNFWQKFPKEFTATREAMTVRLWSSRGGEQFDLRPQTIGKGWPEEWLETVPKALADRVARINTSAIGLARTHEVILTLSGPPAPEVMAADAAALQTPAIALVDPRWLRFTEAMGRFHPYDPTRFPDEEAFAEQWFDQHMSIWRQWGDYGVLEFGNWPHVWYRKGKDGVLQDRWYANFDRYSGTMDYGTYAHLWRMFVRGGKREYFDAAEETTRHRLDMSMSHWTSPNLADELQFDHYQRMSGRLKGTYTASNSPIPWAGRYVRFNHQSGTDIRALAYLYYLTDFRPAREMIEHYSNAVKRVWDSGNPGALLGSRPFATLKNLATAYQETGDLDLKNIAEQMIETLTDLDTPQGVDRTKEATGLAKYGVKVGALHRVHETMGNELARSALVKGSTTRALNSLGEAPGGYYNVAGEQFAAAWDLTGDPVFLRALRRDMELAVSRHLDPKTSEWDETWGGLGPSASANIYPLGGMAFAMDAIVRHETATGETVPLTPFARQPGFGHPMLAVVHKPAGKEVRLDVRSLHALDPYITDAPSAMGAVVGSVERIPFEDQLYSLEKAATRWELILPAELPEGDYWIHPGVDGLMWEVTWTNADHIVMFTPQTLLLGSAEGRQWGSRIMPVDADHEVPVYFQAPEDAMGFKVFADPAVELIDPEGKTHRVRADWESGSWVDVPESLRGKLWALRSNEPVFVRIEGVLPVFAYGDPKRFFLPNEVKKELSTKHGSPSIIVRPGETYVATSSIEGEPQHGIVLTDNRRLAVPGNNPALLPPEEGTLEFWIAPMWNSTAQFRRSNAVRRIMDGGAWSLLLHRYGEMSVTAIVESETNRGRVQTIAGTVLDKGNWTHFALQWRKRGNKFVLELFIDGKQQRFGARGIGMPGMEEDFVPAASESELIFGGPRSGGRSLDAVFGGLRFSKVARYNGDFDPRTVGALEDDTDTLALFLFDKNTEAVKSGIRAEIVEPTSRR